MGLGMVSTCWPSLVPIPPAKITTFIFNLSLHRCGASRTIYQLLMFLKIIVEHSPFHNKQISLLKCHGNVLRATVGRDNK
jgi:hypothetical protein